MLYIYIHISYLINQLYQAGSDIQVIALEKSERERSDFSLFPLIGAVKDN